MAHDVASSKQDARRGKLVSASVAADYFSRMVDQLSGKLDQLWGEDDFLSGKLDQLPGDVDHLPGKVDQLSGKVDHFPGKQSFGSGKANDYGARGALSGGSAWARPASRLRRHYKSAPGHSNG